MTLDCHLCGDTATHLLKRRDNRDLYRCGACDLVFIPREQHVSIDEERAEYLLHDNTMACEGYVKMFEDKIAVMEAHWSGARSVL
ncbi:MAG: hypothetical protein O3A46_09610, partial [Candidatus Poribacteria bacterium]|nr:hypothetical protein [Candidatus Poribacteria bacterium]